jgi:hypothetical protein
MSRTDFLFAIPSFVGGMASALDLGATLVEYNESPSPKVADAVAIQADWIVTGDDILSAMNNWQGATDGEE